jgi:aminomethyltransferase
MSVASAPQALNKTPLYDWHAAHGGRMVDFAGWLMPVQYSSIVEEHRATRQAIGLFDVSHMGRFRFSGTGAGAFLDRLLTRSIAKLSPGHVRYSLVTGDDGGILDDVLIYRLSDKNGVADYLLVVNASNRIKIRDWIARQQPDASVRFEDVTTGTAMLAVQGPHAATAVRAVTDFDCMSMKYYTAVETTVGGASGIVGRTGYTGEDGWELIVPADRAVTLWQAMLDAGRSLGAKPAGLGSRDTLRLEAGMPLYGHELTESINPLQAGLKFAVDLEGRHFPGRDALGRIAAGSGQPIRVGLTLQGKRAPREHYEVFSGSKRIGEITSGTFSPTFDHPIAMAYVDASSAAPGTIVEVDIRGRREPATVVKLPFYKRAN